MVELKLTPEQRRLVDEYTEVRSRVMAWRPAVNPHAARFQELEEALLVIASTVKADKPAILKGDRTTVPVTACENKRKIVKIAALFKRLGAKWVAANCKPTLKVLEKSGLTDAEFASFVKTSRTGNRTLGEPAEHDTAVRASAA